MESRLKSSIFFSAPALSSKSHFQSTDTDSTKKKILFISSRGGYGHSAAANAIQDILGSDKYLFKVIHAIDEMRVYGVRENFYNMMILNNWIRTMNLITRYLMPSVFLILEKKIQAFIDQYLEREKPDLIISVIPFINFPLCEAARKRNIPFLLVTTDNDLENWSLRLEKITHPDFKMTIGTDREKTKESLLSQDIPASWIEPIGLPLRSDFFMPRDRALLRAEYNIGEDKSVVLLMMGGAGGKTALKYARKIASMDMSIHLIVCTGKNERLGTSLQKIRPAASNSLTILGFTTQVADLMAISDVLITKPGPGTITEAIAMHLPILIDNTSHPLLWEQANIELVLEMGIGDRIQNHHEIESILHKYLKDKDLRKSIQEAYQRLSKNQFHEKVETVVQTLLKQTHLSID